MSVLGVMVGVVSAVPELASSNIATREPELGNMIGGTTSVSLLGDVICSESLMSELWDVFGGMSALSAATVPGYVLNSASAMPELVRVNCGAAKVPAHLPRSSQFIPPFHADG